MSIFNKSLNFYGNFHSAAQTLRKKSEINFSLPRFLLFTSSAHQDEHMLRAARIANKMEAATRIWTNVVLVVLLFEPLVE